jgi:hypothetical protein
MKKWILICLLLSCTLACNTAMRGGAKTEALKAGMPNTVALHSGEVVYDLSGEWEFSLSACGHSRSGVIKMTQEGDRFVGTMVSGDYPYKSGKGEEVKGKIEGSTLTDVYFYTWQGWAISNVEIRNSGNEIVMETPLSECPVSSILKRK